jgi:hypothetical protein
MMITRQREAMGVSHNRLLILLSMLVAGAAGALFWPLEQHVTLNFVLEPVRMHCIRTEVPGELAWSPQVQEGAWIIPAVNDNAPVAVLTNNELRCEAKKLSAQIDQTNIDIAQNQVRQNTPLLEQLRKRLATLLREQQRLQRQITNLEVKAPFAGRVLAPDVQLKQMQNRYLTVGSPLFLLGDTRELTAKVWVPEETVSRIFKQGAQLNQQAELMLYGFSADKFQGYVAAVGSHREDSMGEFEEKLALSNKVGGEVVTEYDSATKKEKPVQAVYEVTIKLDPNTVPSSARSYMSGRTRIECGRYTLFQWGWDSLLRFISPEVRL